MTLKDRKQYDKEYYQKNKRLAQERWLIRSYGMTFEDYDRLLEEQEFCCALCEQHISTLKKPLVVDHDHDTNKVRGLLCNKCNPALGMLGDNIEGLERALNYLKRTS